ncbi:hypothetical protein O4H52_06480 [Sphingomonadaceae bacterium G21617-S1]|uniref:hypothetical protein n=1 Tax=Rhizorhabdus sp. TaxID=1968843 RepID=UPI00199430F2|nr:hypothetical protein [Rhizorhabdus sp.]MBD3760154.1 hypothetical protein [Rhizorhabdus sp.]MCZ4341239.1 hypothetical protein [Sphingomonadaceae bacterium G21617-S1]
MALFKHKPAADAAPFKERRVRGKVVSFSADIVAEHVPSPAHALQQMLADRAADGFITDAAERRRALVRFVGLTLVLWGGSATALVLAMILAS